MVVVFDLDGTVVDSTRVLLESHAAAWASVGRPCPPPETILELIGLPLVDTMQKLDPTQDAEHLAEVYSKAYVEGAHHEKLFDGIADLLAKPFRAAVATGKSQRGAERVVKQFGFEERFEIVLGGNSVPRPKPHPDMKTLVLQSSAKSLRQHTSRQTLIYNASSDIRCQRPARQISPCAPMP